MGSELTENPSLRVYAALNNCAFVSTDIMHNPRQPRSKAFCFLMDASMLGVGVGFDVKGALPAPGGSAASSGVMVHGPAGTVTQPMRVEDSRAGTLPRGVPEIPVPCNSSSNGNEDRLRCRLGKLGGQID
jgi:ribonucleoside-triphosphate reductase (thioredoxin)